MNNLYWLNLLALGWFIVCWFGYQVYASKRAKHRACLSNTLDLYRQDWMRRMLLRENRISDTSAVGNLERNGAFFASSSLLIIASILTAIGYSNKAMALFTEIPVVGQTDLTLWQLKLAVLLVVFVYAFFKFTWAMRQYNFCSVMIGAAPVPSEDKVSFAAKEAFALSAARVANHAGDTFNLGLRAYYYAMAVLSWLVHPLLFMGISALVVLILYHREFRSRALRDLRLGKTFEESATSGE